MGHKTYILEIILVAGFFVLTGISIANAQQKAMFSQYMFNGLVINPAYSAMDDALNINAAARHQWVGFKGAPNTQSFTVHSPIKESNSSAGLILMRDQIGEVINENSAFGTYAQKVQVGDYTYIAAGVNAGISKYSGQYSMSGSESSATDPVFTDHNSLRGNFGLGVMIFSDKFYAGISSPFFYYRDLGEASSTFTAHKPHYLLQGGVLFNLNDDVKFKPNVLVKYVNGSPVQIDLNANFLLKETLWIGGSLRTMDSFDVLAEMQVTPNMQVGYSYDFTTTALSQVERGSHEIVLSFRIAPPSRSLPHCYF
jgi:type IX secretion system PorP/SprF family membrane protein